MSPGRRPTNRGSLQGKLIQKRTGRAPPPVKSQTSNVQADDVRYWRKADIHCHGEAHRFPPPSYNHRYRARSFLRSLPAIYRRRPSRVWRRAALMCTVAHAANLLARTDYCDSIDSGYKPRGHKFAVSQTGVVDRVMLGVGNAGLQTRTNLGQGRPPRLEVFQSSSNDSMATR